MRKRKPKQKSVTFNTGYIGLTVKVAGDPFEVNVRGETFVTDWQGDTASTLEKWVEDHGQSVRQKLGGYALYEEGEVKAPFKEFALSGNVSVSSEAEDVTLQSSQLETVWGNKLEGGVSVNLYGAGKTVQFFNEADYKAFLSEVSRLKIQGGAVSTPCFLSDIRGVIVREVNGEITYEQVPYDKYAKMEDFTYFWFNDNVIEIPPLNLSSGNKFLNAFAANSLKTFPPNMFDELSDPEISCFTGAFAGGNSIDPKGVENILVSIDTSGAIGPFSPTNKLDIETDGDTLTTASQTAITNLKAKNWNIRLNNVSQ